MPEAWIPALAFEVTASSHYLQAVLDGNTADKVTVSGWNEAACPVDPPADLPAPDDTSLAPLEMSTTSGKLIALIVFHQNFKNTACFGPTTCREPLSVLLFQTGSRLGL